MLFKTPKIVCIEDLIEIRFHPMTIRQTKNFIDEYFGKISMWVVDKNAKSMRKDIRARLAQQRTLEKPRGKLFRIFS